MVAPPSSRGGRESGCMCIDWPLCARVSKDGGGLMLRDASQRSRIVKESVRIATGFTCVLRCSSASGRTRWASILSGHAHIDTVVAYPDVDRSQTIFGIATMAAGLDVEFPAVPGAHDVALGR